jgi:hypothetical protein
MIIYKITNNVNEKVYIGQTVHSASRRFRDHCIKSNKNSKSALSNAIRKYGKEKFTIQVVDRANSIDELNMKEVEWIKSCNSLYPNGYNLELGGNNKRHHKETKKKLSINKPFSVYRKNGEFVGIWDSEKQCADDLNIGKSHIGCCLKDTRIITGGYVFCFNDEIHKLNEKLTLAQKRFRSRPKLSEEDRKKKSDNHFTKKPGFIRKWPVKEIRVCDIKGSEV